MDFDRTKLAMVVIGKQFRLTRDFYDKTHYFKPLEMEGRVLGVGRSSFVMEHSFRSTTTEKCLWNNTHWCILLEKKTWRPANIPDNIRKAYPPLETTLSPKPLASMAKPNGRCNVSTRVVEWSAVDEYVQVHNSEYERFAHDAASVIQQKYGLSGFKEDLANYPVKYISALHKRATAPGDKLDIYVWWDEDNACKLKFHVCKSGEDEPQCELVFDYHPEPLTTMNKDTLGRM